MKFPTRLLAANMVFAILLWVGFLLLVGAITAGIAVFGQVSGSVWDPASQLARFYALFTGVALAREYLPMYIAHGQTRRQFGAQAAVTITLFAPFLSVLITLGYLLENVLHGVAGWPQGISRDHLFGSTSEIGLIFAEYAIEFLVWTVAGALMGAGFYRWEGGGVVTIPVGIAMVLVSSGALGTDLRIPFLFLTMLNRLRLDLQESLPLGLAVGLGTFAVGLALAWAIIRDVPLRNRPR
ncbi:hypothetical protein [Acrocarpospora catenulata]|uniref:hypothetical protein n=1 Tax=Acrocarpospora catenulata TaxID=2836182 RepID=UPI001BD918A2|nr:hypothetical protein [Acrocarpospora catenulata]